MVSSPSSCPPRSGSAHDLERLRHDHRPPQSALDPERSSQHGPASEVQRASLRIRSHTCLRPRRPLAFLLSRQLSHARIPFLHQTQLARARVPPLFFTKPPPRALAFCLFSTKPRPLSLPPFLPEHAGNFQKEAFSRQIGDARTAAVVVFFPRRVKSTAATPFVRGRVGERGPPAFPRRRPGLWQPCAEVERGGG